MHELFKVILTMFCLLIISFTSTGLIISSMNASKADAFLSDASIGVAEGNFQDSVIKQWQSEALERKYQLEVIKKDTNTDGYTDAVDLTLTYQYVVPYLNLSGSEHTIKAYAR